MREALKNDTGPIFAFDARENPVDCSEITFMAKDRPGLFADNRVGLLYMITKTLFDLHLDIRIAKIATKGDQIADVFYVFDFQGQKIEDEAHLKEIEGALHYQLIQE